MAERFLAAGFFAVALAEIVGSDDRWKGPLVVNVVLALAMCAPLAWIRTRPLTAFALIAVPSVVYGLIWDLPASVVAFFAAGWAALSLGTYQGAQQRYVPAALLAFIAAIEFTQPSIVGLEDAIWPACFLLVAYIAGRLVRNRQQLIDRLRGQQDLVARAAVVDERTRIARELHDVVAHSVSVMVVQAAGGRAQLHRHPERAEEMLASIEQTGREALGELRRLLGVLRIAPGDGAALTPQPGLDELPALLAHAHEAGLEVSISIEGERRALPAGADLVAYRIIQEAITNVLRHSGTATAQLKLGFGDRELALEILDSGRGASRSTFSDGAGHGLAGIRERVALYDGRTETGPRAEGGFAVRAWLPLSAPLTLTGLETA